jgi:hypothetical protein
MRKTRANLTTFLIRNQILVSLSLASLLSCGHGQIPAWDAKLHAADSATQSVVLKEKDSSGHVVEVERIKCGEPKFDQGAWVSYAALRELYVIMNSCKEWRAGTPMMSASEVLQRWQILQLDFEREAASEK